MKNEFNENFIFLKELKSELEWLLDNPEKIPSPLCFYGEPGNGKSSFAKFLGKHLSGDTTHIDMNDFKTNGESSGQTLDRIKYLAMTTPLVELDSDFVWNRVVILDEWHNATYNQQDAYKMPFEKYTEDNHILFILCLNTGNGKRIDDVLSPAIKSRCHTISFDTTIPQLPELRKMVLGKYPKLTEAQVMTMLPDMRQIKRAVSMS